MPGTEMLIKCMLSEQMSKCPCDLRLPGQPHLAKVMTGNSLSYVTLANGKDKDDFQETVCIPQSSPIPWKVLGSLDRIHSSPRPPRGDKKPKESTGGQLLVLQSSKYSWASHATAQTGNSIFPLPGREVCA